MRQSGIRRGEERERERARNRERAKEKEKDKQGGEKRARECDGDWADWRTGTGTLWKRAFTL